MLVHNNRFFCERVQRRKTRDRLSVSGESRAGCSWERDAAKRKVRNREWGDGY